MKRYMRLGAVVGPALLPALLGGLLVAACEGETPPGGFSRTRRLVAGPAGLIGADSTSCSFGRAIGQDTPDRWCGFHRPAAGGTGTELWTINISGAARVGGEIRCDGSSPLCRLVTRTLWTGEPIFSPSHPFIHGFEGDTLVYYADAVSTGKEDAFLGPVQGWRPELSAPRALTGPGGLACVGQVASEAVLCLENEKQVEGLTELDLLAGYLSQAGSAGLPFIQPVRPLDARGDLYWQVAFSPDGATLAFSTQAPGTELERLQVVPTAQAGLVPPREILRDIARWQFAPDGKKIYYLKGYQHANQFDGMGTLTVASFPEGTGEVPLVARVGRFDVHGEPGGPATSIGLLQDMTDLHGNFRFMHDLTRPAELTTIAQQIEDVFVSPDRRFGHFTLLSDLGDVTSVLARTDGGGQCALNFKPNHQAFGVRFAGAGNLVFWGEDAEADSAINEGYFADPRGCTGKTLFTSRLAYLEATHTGVLFGKDEGGGLTMSLHHGRLGAAGTFESRDIGSGADTLITLVDQRWVVYTVSRGDPAAQGLYLHGPLPL